MADRTERASDALFCASLGGLVESVFLWGEAAQPVPECRKGTLPDSEFLTGVSRMQGFGTYRSRKGRATVSLTVFTTMRDCTSETSVLSSSFSLRKLSYALMSSVTTLMR